MKLYGAVDLHSNNNFSMISDHEDRVVAKKKLDNTLEDVDRFFSAYKEELSAIVVESTYNGYWLVDGLMERGYDVKLANPSAMQPYGGLKYSDDENDALWLNRMNRLGILPEGYIYSKEGRGLRDLLRKRMFLVQTRTNLVNSLKHQYQSWKGMEMSQGTSLRSATRPGPEPRASTPCGGCKKPAAAEAPRQGGGPADCRSGLEKLKPEQIGEVFEDEYLQQSARSLAGAILFLSQQIDSIQTSVCKALKEDGLVRRLQLLPGIGKILGWMIRLEIGELNRFGEVGHYLSYCGLVESRRMSNEKLKGRGNAKNRNKYLRWAYGEAAVLALRHAPRIRKYHDRLVRKKGPIKAKAIIASKLARISFKLLKDPNLVYDESKLFF